MRAPLVPIGSLSTCTTSSSPSWSRSSIGALRAPLVPGQLLEPVGGVQEGVALEPQVHECRLHPRQHARDPALVDAADDAALRLALHEDLGDDTVLEECDRSEER